MDQDSDAEPMDRRKAPRYKIAPESRWFVVLLAMIVTLPSFSIDSCLVSLPTIGSSLRCSPTITAMILSLFMVGFSGGQVVFGPLCDRYGRRPTLLFGCVLFTIGALGCGLAPSIQLLVFCRFIQGLGAAAGSVMVFAIVRDLFTGTAARVRFAYVNVVATIAPMIAPTLGGLVAAWAGWRFVFLFIAVAGAFVTGVIALSLEESIQVYHREALELKSLAGNYWRVISHPTCFGYAMIGGLSFGGLFAYVSGSALVFIEVFKVDPRVYGGLFAINAFCIAIGALISGKLARRGVPGRRLIVVGLSIAVVTSSSLLALSIGKVLNPFLTMPFLMLNTFSMGLVTPNVVHGTLEPLPEIAGVASSFFGSVRMIAGAISSELVAILYQGSPVAMSETMAIFSLAALVFGYLLFRPSSTLLRRSSTPRVVRRAAPVAD